MLPMHYNIYFFDIILLSKCLNIIYFLNYKVNKIYDSNNCVCTHPLNLRLWWNIFRKFLKHVKFFNSVFQGQQIFKIWKDKCRYLFIYLVFQCCFLKPKNDWRKEEKRINNTRHVLPQRCTLLLYFVYNRIWAYH